MYDDKKIKINVTDVVIIMIIIVITFYYYVIIININWIPFPC